MPTENKPAEPLKIERSTVTKLVITGAPRLDLIIARAQRTPLSADGVEIYLGRR